MLGLRCSAMRRGLSYGAAHNAESFLWKGARLQSGPPFPAFSVLKLVWRDKTRRKPCRQNHLAGKFPQFPARSLPVRRNSQIMGRICRNRRDGEKIRCKIRCGREFVLGRIAHKKARLAVLAGRCSLTTANKTLASHQRGGISWQRRQQRSSWID